ncbi:MAG: ribonuclease J [Gammaproteobacteria bacterium]|nr:ribonuclease J [Gammaproteobacteria bacterium]
MYVFETEHDLLILDIGSKPPTNEVNGYEILVPYYQYVLDHIDKLKGVFISKFGRKTSGAFLKTIRDLNVPFYGSPFTIESIKKRYLIDDDANDEVDLKVLNAGEILEFEDVKIEAFNVSASLPDSYGYSIKVNIADEGEDWKNVVYIPDSNFDLNMWGHFRIDFKTLTKIADEGVIVLLSPSSGATNAGHITTDGNLGLALRKLMSQENRTFCLMSAENLSGILQLIDAAYAQNRKVTIMGHKARFLVELAMDMGYTRVDKSLYVRKEDLTDEIRNSDNSVIILAGDSIDTFSFMDTIATYQDKHYILKPTDNVVLILDTPKKYEKDQAKIWNEIWFNNAKLVDFDISLMPTPCAGAEDLKLFYSILSPQYIVPIIGNYRDLKAQDDTALKFGFTKEQIIDIDNGDVIVFEDNQLKHSDEVIEVKETLFGSSADSDINDFVAREREALTKEGFLIISEMINLRERKVHGDIQIVSSGFLPEFGQQDEYDSIKKEFNSIIVEHLKQKKVDYKELRLELKNEISKKILKDTRKRPILIPVIIDVSGLATVEAD